MDEDALPQGKPEDLEEHPLDKTNPETLAAWKELDKKLKQPRQNGDDSAK
jgi:hypothetical protein